MKVLGLVLAFGLSVASAQRIYEDLDAVVIEAAEGAGSLRKTERQARQLFDLQIQPELAGQLGLEATGQPCITGDQRFGKCLPINECFSYFRILDVQQSGAWIYGSYDTCGSTTTRGKVVKGVCCPSVAKPALPEEPEEEFPVEFSTLNPSTCGRANYCATAKIVQGVETCKHELPFMAALLNRGRHFCGGSLVDKRHVVTAAHCVAHMSKFDVQNLRVNLGDHDVGTKAEGSHQSFKVKRVIRHKGFDQKTLHSDVAILTLDREVPSFNAEISPICLATEKSQNFAGQEVEVAGWGTLGEGRGQSKQLRKVTVKVWQNARCKSSYGSQAPGGIIDSMVCANHLNPLRDSCSGDSGGPLYKCNGGRCEQVGIVSWGIGCAKPNYPGVYTRITYLLPWITKICAKY